ncbi:LysR family transcriptional regulator [Ideonella sp. B508-1]|uniref:LysR family transcriptional regulator n=1 Tax=Ideonella sp. B508-1 TaxID=137716 RepID=UPI00034849BD|nr:LysR family transcriptional regulator [Ideonella sp. B508-1]
MDTELPQAWSRHLHMRHLHWLALLGETRNLSEAARQAHTTQPGLSKWLRDLEDDVGSPLFERHARGLHPTAVGELLLLYAQRVLGAMRRAEQDVAAVRQGGRRRVVLGCSAAANAHLVPEAIRLYMQRMPDIQVGLRESTMDALLPQLEHVQLDVAVGRLDDRPWPGLQQQWLYVEPIVLVCCPDHPLARLAEVGWEDARAHPWIVWPSGTPIRANLESGLTSIGVALPPRTLESSSMLANLSLLRDSDMLMAVSAHVGRHFAAQGLVARLPLTVGSAGALGFYWRDATEVDPAIQTLLDCLREAARTLQVG